VSTHAIILLIVLTAYVYSHAGRVYVCEKLRTGVVNDSYVHDVVRTYTSYIVINMIL